MDTLALSKKCLEEITSLLVSSGYSKAGDLGAGEVFDVVVGGLAWLITSTLTEDLDCSLPTLLNASSISTRISLSETLHQTLQKMGMPLEISPHQIQGVDAPLLLPVIKWTVKNFLSKRAAVGRKILVVGGAVEYRKNFAAGSGNGESESLADLVDRYRVTNRRFRFNCNETISESQAVHKVISPTNPPFRSHVPPAHPRFRLPVPPPLVESSFSSPRGPNAKQDNWSCVVCSTFSVRFLSSFSFSCRAGRVCEFVLVSFSLSVFLSLSFSFVSLRLSLSVFLNFPSRTPPFNFLLPRSYSRTVKRCGRTVV